MYVVPLGGAMAAARVLMTSVPDSQAAMARQSVEDAVVTSARFSRELVAAHPDVEVLSCMVHDTITLDDLSGWPRLRGVVTRSAGHDHLPVAGLAARGVVPCALSDYAISSVTQHTLMLVLALLRRLPEATSVTQRPRTAGREPSWSRSGLVGRNLGEVTVGVLGTGRIGGSVVRAFVALGVEVVGHDLVEDPALKVLPGFRYVQPLSAFLAAADVLTLHVPLTQATRRMIDRAALERLPRGAVLVNTSRGAVVDHLAVLRALDAGRLAGFATDVLPGEPKPPLLSRFRDYTNVMVTPHLGAYDRHAIRSRYEHNARVTRALLDGATQPLDSYRVDGPVQLGRESEPAPGASR